MENGRRPVISSGESTFEFMALGFKFSLPPEFQPGETVLHFKEWVWAVSSKSPPSARLFLSLPPVTDAGMYVTDRRIVLAAYTFRLMAQQFNIWFPGKEQGEEPEIFKAVSTGRNAWLGDYLELLSEDAQPHWYRSRELRLRIFMRHPEVLHQLIAGLTCGTNCRR
jgi:hypothetical protein